MRSCSRPDLRPCAERLAALFEVIEQESADATAEDLKVSIGLAASLGAVFQARYVAAVSSAPASSALLSRYLDPKAAAAFLGISRSTLLRLVKVKALCPSHPTEGTVRFDREALERFMAERLAKGSLPGKRHSGGRPRKRRPRRSAVSPLLSASPAV